MSATDPTAKAYKFVPLHPDGKKTSDQVSGHDKWRNLTGTLTCTIKALTPLHVASGMVIPAAELHECQDIAWPANFTEPLVLEHYRSSGKRVIPATSLKGCIRSIVEAISRSCVSKCKRKDVAESKGSRPQDRSPFKKSQECQAKSGQPLRLCPACRLFGAMGFEGKVRFSDAPQSGGNGLIAFRPAPNQPNRVFRDGKGIAHPVHREQYYQDIGRMQWQIKGRKFYLHFGQPKDQRVKYEPVEVCAQDSVFTFQMEFESLQEDELGLLLAALGQGNGVKVFKLGGSKPFGYGAVEVTHCQSEVWSQSGWRERCLSWDENSSAPQDWAELSRSAMTKAQTSGLILMEQLEQLKAILNQTPLYAAEDIACWQKGGDKYV